MTISRMTLSRREVLVALITGALGVAALVGIVLDSWRVAALGVIALQMVNIALVLVLARRRAPSGKDAKVLARIERAIDNVSLRVVTETDATRRELAGLIDELDRSVKRPD